MFNWIEEPPLVPQAAWSSNDKSAAEPQGMPAIADTRVAGGKRMEFIFRSKFV